jgi:GNAT superfamily N-acetyltransferase
MGRRVIPLTAERLGDLGSVGDLAWTTAAEERWGPCGQLVLVDDQSVGVIAYAPAEYVPADARRGRSPISGDAVLMVVVFVEPDQAGQGLGRVLVQSAAKDLSKRGVRALEAYGHRGDEVASPYTAPLGFLEAAGFGVVRDHPAYPRVRLDLRTAVTWREPVGAALGRLRSGIRAFPAGATRG